MRQRRVILCKVGGAFSYQLSACWAVAVGLCYPIQARDEAVGLDGIARRLAIWAFQGTDLWIREFVLSQVSKARPGAPSYLGSK
jgi:hypothetical protein